MSMEGSQRTPAPVSIHGHRKMTGALATLYSGEIAGQDIIKFVWDSAVEVVNWSAGTPLQPMPEDVAASIFGLFAVAAWYQMKEQQ